MLTVTVTTAPGLTAQQFTAAATVAGGSGLYIYTWGWVTGCPVSGGDGSTTATAMFVARGAGNAVINVTVIDVGPSGDRGYAAATYVVPRWRRPWRSRRRRPSRSGCRRS